MELTLKIFQLMIVLVPLAQKIVEVIQETLGQGNGPVKKELVKSSILDGIIVGGAFADIPTAHVQGLVDRQIERAVSAMKAKTL